MKAQTVSERLWTAAELSAEINVALSTIYCWTSIGFLPHLKIGGVIRFKPSEIQAWLDRHARPGRDQRVPGVDLNV